MIAVPVRRFLGTKKKRYINLEKKIGTKCSEIFFGKKELYVVAETYVQTSLSLLLQDHKRKIGKKWKKYDFDPQLSVYVLGEPEIDRLFLVLF